MTVQATLAAIRHDLAEAAQAARLAYDFAPGSYSYDAFVRCLSAQESLDAAKPLFEMQIAGPAT